MRQFIPLFQIGFAVWLGPVTSLSSADQGHVHVQHEAHEHGNAQLNLALEKTSLMLELRLPAMDVLGFEHAPHDDTQKTQVDKAQRLLENAAELFTPGAAAHCKVASVQAERRALQHEAAHEHNAKVDHEHDTAAEHGNDDHHEHGAASEHDERHAEFHARYAFHCAKPDALKGIDIHVFTQFPSLQKLQVQAVTERDQTALGLSPSQTYVNLP